MGIVGSSTAATNATCVHPASRCVAFSWSVLPSTAAVTDATNSSTGGVPSASATTLATSESQQASLIQLAKAVTLLPPGDLPLLAATQTEHRRLLSELLGAPTECAFGIEALQLASTCLDAATSNQTAGPPYAPGAVRIAALFIGAAQHRHRGRWEAVAAVLNGSSGAITRLVSRSCEFIARTPISPQTARLHAETRALLIAALSGSLYFNGPTEGTRHHAPVAATSGGATTSVTPWSCLAASLPLSQVLGIAVLPPSIPATTAPTFAQFLSAVVPLHDPRLLTQALLKYVIDWGNSLLPPVTKWSDLPFETFMTATAVASSTLSGGTSAAAGSSSSADASGSRSVWNMWSWLNGWEGLLGMSGVTSFDVHEHIGRRSLHLLLALTFLGKGFSSGTSGKLSHAAMKNAGAPADSTTTSATPRVMNPFLFALSRLSEQDISFVLLTQTIRNRITRDPEMVPLLYVFVQDHPGFLTFAMRQKAHDVCSIVSALCALVVESGGEIIKPAGSSASGAGSSGGSGMKPSSSIATLTGDSVAGNASIAINVDGTGATEAPTRQSLPHDRGMVATMLLLLTNNPEFCVNAFAWRTACPWYPSKYLQDVSLGSAMIIVLCRAIVYFSIAQRDDELCVLYIASIANLAPFADRVDAYAAQRLCSALNMLLRRASKLKRFLDERPSAHHIQSELDSITEHVSLLCDAIHVMATSPHRQNICVLYELLYSKQSILREESLVSVPGIRRTFEPLSQLLATYEVELASVSKSHTPEEVFTIIDKAKRNGVGATPGIAASAAGVSALDTGSPYPDGDHMVPSLAAGGGGAAPNAVAGFVFEYEEQAGCDAFFTPLVWWHVMEPSVSQYPAVTAAAASSSGTTTTTTAAYGGLPFDTLTWGLGTDPSSQTAALGAPGEMPDNDDDRLEDAAPSSRQSRDATHGSDVGAGDDEDEHHHHVPSVKF